MNNIRTKMLEKHLINGVNWQHKHVNKKFLKSLREEFGKKTFTNKDAYVVYGTKHLYYPKFDFIRKGLTRRRRAKEYKWNWIADKVKNDQYLQMNVRNSLCAAVCYPEYGLIRMGLGKYRFVK